MRAPISVIIPTLNAADRLPACLTALMAGLEKGLIRELIVSDGGSVDGTGATAQAWGATVLHGAPSRGGQLRRGCAAAQGEWLLIVHADSVLADGWAEAAAAHVIRSQKAAWCRLSFDEGGGLAWGVAQWANLRSRLGLPYGDQGLLLPRHLYEEVGGYPDQPLMEDVALARALKGQLVPLGVRITTSAARYRAQGWLRRGARNLILLARYFAGHDVENLARSYRR